MPARMWPVDLPLPLSPLRLAVLISSREAKRNRSAGRQRERADLAGVPDSPPFEAGHGCRCKPKTETDEQEKRRVPKLAAVHRCPSRRLHCTAFPTAILTSPATRLGPSAYRTTSCLHGLGRLGHKHRYCPLA